MTRSRLGRVKKTQRLAEDNDAGSCSNKRLARKRLQEWNLHPG